jgi:hypothetical protein
MAPRLVSDMAWAQARGSLEPSLRPAMALGMDPAGKRASAVIAWPQTDGTVGLRVVADVHGDPIDTDALGRDLRQAAMRLGVTKIAFDPWTDADLARYFKQAKPLIGRDYANASAKFVTLIESGQLRWDDADAVSYDLAWTARKPHESGGWQAVKARDDRAIPAALAAIRATWLVSGPRQAAPKVM